MSGVRERAPGARARGRDAAHGPGFADLSARYAKRDVGACVPHVAATIASGDPGLARPLAERLRRDLATGGAFELVAGRDRDAPARAAARAALPGASLAD